MRKKMKNKNHLVVIHFRKKKRKNKLLINKKKKINRDLRSLFSRECYLTL